WPRLGRYVAMLALALAAGCATVWAKSAIVGAPPIAHPMQATLTGTLVDRVDSPVRHRVRLVLATREPGTNRPLRVALTVSSDQAAGAVPGAVVRMRVRLMPPSPPLLPGAYDFARAAWFEGISATGMVAGPVELVAIAKEASGPFGFLADLQSTLSAHVRASLPGAAGGIAAAFASGDRGGIGQADEAAMRDAGLTHLLSVSGLHVSVVMAGSYFLAIRLLAFWPWLALRMRLPIAAGAFSGAVGIAYTLLTGAQVPTVRSCLGALLVLAAVMLGRRPLSMRLLAVAAMAIMLLWPEAVIGPGFQMSFASVMAIIALHDAAPVRRFLARRQGGWPGRIARDAAMMLITGLVIELALMPVALFHFHRAGMYGALANLVAIPLVTFVAMPSIALALLLDLAHCGGPAWWLCGHSLRLLLAIARFTAAQPQAVGLMPQMPMLTYAVFTGGMMWMALWRGRVRLWGPVPVAAAGLSLLWLQPPDVLITGDGRDVAIAPHDGGPLVVLRERRSTFATTIFAEASGLDADSAQVPLRALSDWPSARCNAGFCLATLSRGARDWHLLIARGRNLATDQEMTAACASVDIVVAPVPVSAPCNPRFLLADGAALSRTGGLALNLSRRAVISVAETEARHPWWPAPDHALIAEGVAGRVAR
ncbi:MAG TPA: ComEC/Rec2 family competence protein, partial [Novosphingobium sp.]|nr:ComEC/Rec2 family competence protein [Novosphingobium sp.]